MLSVGGVEEIVLGKHFYCSHRFNNVGSNVIRCRAEPNP